MRRTSRRTPPSAVRANVLSSGVGRSLRTSKASVAAAQHGRLLRYQCRRRLRDARRSGDVADRVRGQRGARVLRAAVRGPRASSRRTRRPPQALEDMLGLRADVFGDLGHGWWPVRGRCKLGRGSVDAQLELLHPTRTRTPRRGRGNDASARRGSSAGRSCRTGPHAGGRSGRAHARGLGMQPGSGRRTARAAPHTAAPPDARAAGSA
jgi:hypothetical protein